MRQNHRDINVHERILPFVGESESIASGGFGDIFKVTIFDSQQEFVIDKVIPRLSLSVLRNAIYAQQSQ